MPCPMIWTRANEWHTTDQ